jgi:hypothetical protein
MTENTPENKHDHARLVGLLLNIGIPKENIGDHIISHNFKEKFTFTQNVNFIYDDHLTSDNKHFLHSSNIDTWLQGSGFSVTLNAQGHVDAVGVSHEEVEDSRPFSKMTDGEREKVSEHLIKKFRYMSGAKSVGLALDNDGAGKADAMRVYRLCLQIGIPTGSLMPIEQKKVPFFIGGKEVNVDLKDHNDFLMLYKAFIDNNQHTDAIKILTSYADNTKLPILLIEKPEITPSKNDDILVRKRA